jgi:opacity protein-like surface antigen
MLFTVGMLMLTSQGHAQVGTPSDGPYIGVVTGPEFFAGGDDAFDYNLGHFIGGQVGYRVGQWRTEGELSYAETEFRDIDNDVFDVEVIRGNASLFYDFAMTPALDAFAPYVGGGVGLSNIAVERGAFDEDETGITLHGEVGMVVDVSPSLSLVPQYRYEWFEQGVAGFDDYFRAHSLRIAAQFGF